MAASPPPQSTLWLRHKDPPRLWPIMLLLSGLIHLGLLIGIWPLIIRFDSQDRTSATIPIELIETIPETDVSLTVVEANPASPLNNQAILPEASEQIQNAIETTSLNSDQTVSQPSSLDRTASQPSSLDRTASQPSSLDQTASQPSSLDQTASQPSNTESTGDQISVSLSLETRGRDIPPVMAQPDSQQTFPLDQITILISCSPPSPEVLRQFSGKKVSIPVVVTDTGQSEVSEGDWTVRSSNADYNAFCKCLAENWTFSPAQGEQGEPIYSDYFILLTITVN